MLAFINSGSEREEEGNWSTEGMLLRFNFVERKRDDRAPNLSTRRNENGTDRRNAGLYNTRENIFYIQVRGCARIFFV